MSEVERKNAGKYKALCDFVRHQSPDAVGVILIVIEPHTKPGEVCAHMSVQIEEEAKHLMPQMLTDLARRIESEQRIERFLHVCEMLRTPKADAPEGE